MADTRKEQGRHQAQAPAAQATLRLYEELNDYLPRELRKRDVAVRFSPPAPVRHLIETLGVPHTEVELILINGDSVGLETSVDDGDRIAVYPVFESLDVSPLLRVRERPLRSPRFIADAQLGRLARYLRLLGFDTLYENDPGDAALVRFASEQRRIILTRDRRLLMRRAVTHGCHIRDDRPLRQLTYVVRRCDLAGLARPFTRCMECNGDLESVSKEAVADYLPEGTRTQYDAFWRCRDCQRLYWKGSHYAALQHLIDTALTERRDCSGRDQRAGAE
ncbi:MAG: Mut7-C ubiquitin/RNAse domain-containing protein [Chromatiaceae bacterium]|nr:Mut7-C ubiquitin/RNAse domain-containing protein [Gammaproteobacteria bacterium]MCP5312175.1 Mut7-C ubiquitin/RNAse domain-containing protein [Chromatiaceae bacterium]